MESLNKLTPRQQEIALLVAEGWEDKLISHRLGVVQETIKTHLMRIYAVFGLRNRRRADIARKPGGNRHHGTKS